GDLSCALPIFTTRGRMFSHVTLMLNSEIEEVVSSLNVSEEKIKSKGIKSIRSRVTNIADHLDEKITMDQFKEYLLKNLFDVEDIADVPRFELTEEDWANIHKISAERYQKWEWNYGKSPQFDIQKSHKFPAGLVDVRMNISKGTIKDVKIYGDFFGVGEVKVIEDKLIGTQYRRQALEEALADVDVPHYLGRITEEEFINLVY